MTRIFGLGGQDGGSAEDAERKIEPFVRQKRPTAAVRAAEPALHKR